MSSSILIQAYWRNVSIGLRSGTKPWDKAIMAAIGFTQLLRYILAGLDQRYGWTSGFPFPAQIIALIFWILGYALFVWAAESNPFFSQLVRIQTERDHSVVTSGPYRYVRHPGYADGVVFELAGPVLLASWVALATGIMGAFLLIIRTALEDRTLRAELPGYNDYSHQVGYRLVPYVW